MNSCSFGGNTVCSILWLLPPVVTLRKSIAEEPRGLPTDIHKFTRALFDKRKNDLHSHSFISGAEFDQFFPWKRDRKDMSHFAIVGHAFRAGAMSVPQRFIFAFDC